MKRLSVSVNCVSLFSKINSLRISACTSSKFLVAGADCPWLSIAASVRRLNSLVNSPQSNLILYFFPIVSKAVLNPVCQSRIVPPVSNVRALIVMGCLSDYGETFV